MFDKRRLLRILGPGEAEKDKRQKVVTLSFEMIDRQKY